MLAIIAQDRLLARVVVAPHPVSSTTEIGVRSISCFEAPAQNPLYQPAKQSEPLSIYYIRRTDRACHATPLR